MDHPGEKKSLKIRIKTFLVESRRVWQVTKKPSKDEFKSILKITALGMLVIGFIGFLVTMLWQMVLR